MSDRTPDTEFAPLAVIGMACRLPGADDLSAYWRLLVEGRSAIGPMPPDRFDESLHYDPRPGVRGKSYTRLGATVRMDTVDATSLPLSAEVIAQADPAHVCLATVAMDACRSAGFDPRAFPHRNTGVYIGHTRGGARPGEIIYGTLIEQTAPLLHEVPGFEALCGGQGEAVVNEIIAAVRQRYPRHGGTGATRLDASRAAGLIAEALTLDGPYLSINAACASGLMALAVAASALHRGEIETAIVGSASFAKSDALVLFSHARSVSATGSRPLDAEADGLIAGEGYTALLVKPLERAIADGNPIHAVIRGIGVASDGRGKSLWAPRAEGQMEAVRRAYGGGVDMSRLQYIEAHATSTQVGDATEIAALATALGDRMSPQGKIPLGSAKSNIGHTLETAGLAGLLKAVLAMQHGLVPPTINLRHPNPQIAWESLPFYVPTEPVAWPDVPGQPRRTAVNAFGIGGLNVHVVLDQYVEGETAGDWSVFRPDDNEVKAERGTRTWTCPPQVAPGNWTYPHYSGSIAVIGMGAVFPGAADVHEFWELLKSGRDPKQAAPPERWSAERGVREESPQPWHSVTARGGFVTDFHYDWRKHKIPPKQIAAADPLQFMLLEAVDEALRHAGYLEKPFDRRRTGVFVGTQAMSEFTEQLQMGLRLPEFERTLGAVLGRRGVSAEAIRELASRYGDLLVERMPAVEDETGSFTSSSLASRVTRIHDLGGGAAAIDAGSASASATLSAAVNMLRSGQADMMICAAGQRALGLTTFEHLSQAGMLGAGQAGLLPGEGAGAVVLKRLADAERDGDTIHAVLEGIGAARGATLGAAVERAMARAYGASNAAPRDVAVVEMAVTGYPPADAAEAASTARCFSERDERLPVSAVAGQIGYTGGAAGMASLLKSVLAMEHGELPALAGLPASALRESTDRLSPAECPTALPVDDSLLAGVTNHNLTDLAYHVVLARSPLRRETVCRRYVLRTIDAPSAARIGMQTDGSQSQTVGNALCGVPRASERHGGPACASVHAAPSPHHAAVILGDNRVAAALRARLEARGMTVTTVATTSDVAATIAVVEAAMRERPATCLFLLTAHDDEAETRLAEPAWSDRLARGVLEPYFACQKWFQQIAAAGLVDQAAVIALGALGGKFGLAANTVRAESGATAGLMKALALEITGQRARGFRSRFVDAALDRSPDELAAILCRELETFESPSEIGHAEGRRIAVQPVMEAVPGPVADLLAPCGVWLATGGARGITAVVARELGRRFSLTLHLIGSSPVPAVDPSWRDLDAAGLQALRSSIVSAARERGELPIEAWRCVEKALEIDQNLRRFVAEGVRATYHKCDVNDRRALAGLLASIHATDGPLEGVLHGAGFESALKFEKKQPADVTRTIFTKVGGAAALMDVLRDEPLRWFIAFGSMSGRFGGVGQTDYSLANDMLAKLVGWYRHKRPECRSTCFHWPSWDEVGMAVRPESKLLKQARGQRFMPPREGAAHVIAELRAGLPESEVLIGEPALVARLSPAPSPTAPLIHSDDWPLLDSLPEIATGARVVAEVHLDPVHDPFLDQHRFRQKPLLPLVVSLEALAEAATVLYGDTRRVTSIEEVTPIKTLQFFTEAGRVAKVEAQADGDRVRCRLTCDFLNRRGQLVVKDQLHLQAAVCLDGPAAPARPRPAEPSQWSSTWYAEREAMLHHGPALCNLPRIALRADGGVGEIVAPALEDLTGRRRGPRHVLPSAALDACLMACGIYIWKNFAQAMALPAGMRRLLLGRLPRTGERCLIDFTFRGREKTDSLYDNACFDFTLFGDDGELILGAEQYRNTILSE